MVSTVLADEQLTGFVGYLRMLAASEPWRELTEAISLRFIDMADAGLPSGTPDRTIWLHCQANGYYLLTDNRNQTGPDSLEQTIRSEWKPNTLPVFTISAMNRFRVDRAYAENVVERLIN